MKKRVISMLILAALAANLAACGDEKTPSKETTSSGNETTSSADDSSPFEKDDLPDNLNFGGSKYPPAKPGAFHRRAKPYSTSYA